MNQYESDFLKSAVPAALQSQKLTGIPASITIAQAILESGWGKTALARKANNFFGIKATAHLVPNQYIEMPTHEFVDGRSTPTMAKFARYASPAESFTAHAALIANADRYAPAMAARGDATAFAREIQACGYSTNPDYAKALMALVNEFDLTQYDLPPTPDAPAQAQAKEKAA